ncbi:Os02g0779500, partial [Oryza sativa Japonica Group]
LYLLRNPPTTRSSLRGSHNRIKVETQSLGV